jgi:hypothetical protein
MKGYPAEVREVKAERRVMRKDKIIKKNLMRSLVAGGMILAAVVFSQNPAQAKMMRGEVAAVKDDGSSFTFRYADPSKPSVIKRFEIVMLPNTRYENMSSLKELATGDDVAVDAEQKNKSGIWEARAVRILKLQIHEGDAARKAPPS